MKHFLSVQFLQHGIDFICCGFSFWLAALCGMNATTFQFRRWKIYSFHPKILDLLFHEWRLFASEKWSQYVFVSSILYQSSLFWLQQKFLNTNPVPFCHFSWDFGAFLWLHCIFTFSNVKFSFAYFSLAIGHIRFSLVQFLWPTATSFPPKFSCPFHFL